MSRRGINIKKQKFRTELGQLQAEQTLNLIRNIRRSTSFPEELLRKSCKTNIEYYNHSDDLENGKKIGNGNHKIFIAENRNRMKSSGQLQTALMTLAICDGDVMQLWRLLGRRGADVHYTDGLGMKPVHYASLYGNIDILKILLQFNVNVNSLTDKGETALEIAVREGNFEVAEYLIKHGAKVKDIVNGMRLMQDEKRVENMRRNSSCDMFLPNYDHDHLIYGEGGIDSNPPRKAIFEI